MEMYMYNQSPEDNLGSNGVIERMFSETFKAMYNRLCLKMTNEKTDSNTHICALKLFKAQQTATLGFPTLTQLRTNNSRAFSALYIFAFAQPHKDGYTHGIYLRLNGFLPRRLFDGFVEAIVHEIVASTEIDLKAVTPEIRRNVPLFDYLQSLYGSSSNLLVNFSNRMDIVSQNQLVQTVDSIALDKLKMKMQATTATIIDTMIAMPERYPACYLTQTLSLKIGDYRKHMRSTNLTELTTRVCLDAYNIALQDRKFKPHEIQHLMEPMTRRSMLNCCITEKATKRIQTLLQQTFATDFVHPHPYNQIVTSDLGKIKPLDGLIFDPRFLFTLLLTSRWFIRACMLEQENSSNNHAHLLLYGSAGTGKTLIVSAISSAIASYKYATDTKFQNPDLLRASIFSIDEFDASSLASNNYKQLLDLKTPVMVDFKNLNPEAVSKDVPCMITTNDDVLSVLQSQRKYNSSSVSAAIRRLYIIPMKMGAFETLHGRLGDEHEQYKETLTKHDLSFTKEPMKLERIFNLIIAFALFQQDIQGLYFDSRIHAYFGKLAKDFQNTAFGTFYLSQKGKVDEIIADVEHTMMGKNMTDSEYLVKVSTCTGRFQQLLTQFITDTAIGATDVNMAIIKDKLLPWPLKAYHMLSSIQFQTSLMWQATKLDTSRAYLNSEVYSFLNNPSMQLFREIDHFAQEKVQEHAVEELKCEEFIQTPKRRPVARKLSFSNAFDPIDYINMDDVFRPEDHPAPLTTAPLVGTKRSLQDTDLFNLNDNSY